MNPFILTETEWARVNRIRSGVAEYFGVPRSKINLQAPVARKNFEQVRLARRVAIHLVVAEVGERKAARAFECHPNAVSAALRALRPKMRRVFKVKIDGLQARIAAMHNEAERPHRIQILDKIGWKLPPNAARVDRANNWVNPYSDGEDTPANRTKLFAFHYRDRESRKAAWMRAHIEELRGKIIACTCSLDDPCHGDFLLEMANPKTRTITPQEIVAFIHGHRWSLSQEKPLQKEIADKLTEARVQFEREIRLSKTEVIDFIIGDVGIEVKIKGARREIYRQCKRYCEHDRVKTLVLVTNVAMGMPKEIDGKPVYIASLGRGWI